MGSDEKKFFVRPASGLVREIDTKRATFFNLYSSIGYAPGMVMAMMSTFALTMIFGIPVFSWGLFISGAFMAIFAVMFIVLASAMPRSGGDYVWSSRILHPYLGYIESWGFVFTAGFGTLAYGTWYCATTFASNFAVLAFTGDKGWLSLASTLASADWILLLGTLMFVAIVAVVVLLPTRGTHTLLTVSCVLAFVCMAIPILTTLGTPLETFKGNLASLGLTYDGVIQLAKEAGWPGQEPLNWSNLNLVLVWGLWAYMGFQLSTYHAGELKGKIARNATIAIYVGLLGAVVANAVWPLYFYNLAGPDFTYSWGYLFWNAPDKAILSQPPYPQMLAAIARPQLAPLFWVCGLGIGFLLMFILNGAYLMTTARVLFAMSIDRMLPSFLSDVNPRTHSPVKLYVVLAAASWLFFALSNRGLWSPLNTAWFTTLGWFASWLFPGLNAMLLPYRRKDLYESVPSIWKKKFGPLPITTILGIVWTVFILAIYIQSALYPILNQASASTEGISFAISSGIIAIAAMLVFATIGYLLAVWYNRRRGIDVGMTFKTIPPD